MNPIFSCIASLGLTGEITCFQNATQPTAFGSLTWWKIRCWMTARSHLRRQLIDFVWAPRGLPASSRSCSTCFAGGSIWRFTRWLELSSRLSPQPRLPWERAESCALPTVPPQSPGPKRCVFWPGTCFIECELWHIMKAEFKNKIQNTINFILITCEKSSQPSNLFLTSIYIPVNFFPSSLLV